MFIYCIHLEERSMFWGTRCKHVVHTRSIEVVLSGCRLVAWDVFDVVHHFCCMDVSRPLPTGQGWGPNIEPPERRHDFVHVHHVHDHPCEFMRVHLRFIHSSSIFPRFSSINDQFGHHFRMAGHVPSGLVPRPGGAKKLGNWEKITMFSPAVRQQGTSDGWRLFAKASKSRGKGPHISKYTKLSDTCSQWNPPFGIIWQSWRATIAECSIWAIIPTASMSALD